MDLRRNKPRALCGFALGICLAVSALAGPLCVSASAQSTPSEEEKKEAEEKAKKLADEAIGTVMKLNKQVGLALSIVKGLITSDPFAIINALIGLMGSDGEIPDITVRQARDEIIAEMRKEREEELTNRVSALVEWFAELIANPSNMTYQGRLEDYLNEALAVTVDLRAVMTNPDPVRAEMAYHLAAAYNTAVSSRIVGLSTAEYEESSIDSVVEDAITTNDGLVRDDDEYGGYLYNVVQKEAGRYSCWLPLVHPKNSMWVDGASQYEMDLEKGWVLIATSYVNGRAPLDCDDKAGIERMLNTRFDADPIVYMVRNAASDLRSSLTAQ
jgi:hypothetical protein